MRRDVARAAAFVVGYAVASALVRAYLTRRPRWVYAPRPFTPEEVRRILPPARRSREDWRLGPRSDRDVVESLVRGLRA